jgi:hypothetical protein
MVKIEGVKYFYEAQFGVPLQILPGINQKPVRQSLGCAGVICTLPN